VLFLPHAARHYLSYARDHLPDNTAGMRISTWDEGETGFVCGEFELGMPHSPLWRALPAEIVVRRADAGEVLARLIELIVRESAAPRFGRDAVVERLCDSIFVLVVRHCIEANLVSKGVFAAMQDRRLATVLGLIHAEPWRPWTLADLCARAGVSKTVLAGKVAASIGMSPIEYLTDWRMQIAGRWLKESGMTIERVAERCGYESVPAFSKAFKRCFGVAPGAYRRGPADPSSSPGPAA